MTMICKMIIVFALAAPAVIADPVAVSVTFRDSATVNDTVIRLGDIAVIHSACSNDRISQLKNVVVGESAPAGYNRKVSTDEVCSYVLKKAASASGFSFDRVQKKAVVVATGFQEKKVNDFKAMIEKYLTDSVRWQPGDFSTAVKNTEDKWKCLNRPVNAEVTGLITKYPKGNVNLRLIVRQFSRTYSIPVQCFVTVVTQVVTLKAPVPRGTLLSSENCMLERKDITRFACDPFTSLDQVRDLVANRSLQAETILHEKLTTRQPIIGRDEQVYVVVDKQVVKVSIIMRARQQGALGDKIWVENEATHKLLKTKIIGKGKVELLEGEKTI
jgi:flagella basal body P-ring formation protein FlgA